MKKVTFKKLEPEMPIDKIDVAKENVRKVQLTAGLDDLKGSIGELSLIQPVIVIAKGDRFKLIVGQRRFLAAKALGRTRIPALIIEPMDSVSQTLVSFGENVHRRNLPYEDTIRVCDELFKEYTGVKNEKIHKIVKTLGLSRSSVTKYLAYKLVPPEVRELVSKGKLSQDVAYRITAAYFPDNKKIISVAKESARLTKAETRRAIDYGTKKPNAPIEEIMEYAMNPPPTVEIIIQVEQHTAEILKALAKEKGSTVADLVKDAIKDMIEDEK
ncbi:MAG: ParB/RepB/Spo0J family partition protein [Nitrosotalea sp.]